MSEPIKKLKMKESLYPMGGYAYKDADGVQHLANNLLALVKAVSTYRARTGRPLGDPEQDILKQLCARQPKACKEYVPGHDAPSLTRAVASDAVRTFTEKEFTPVSEEEANARAEICLKCRAKVSWGADCPPCLLKAGDMISKLLERLPKHKALKEKACLHALDDLQLAVWKTEGRAVLSPPSDSGCWRQSE